MSRDRPPTVRKYFFWVFHIFRPRVRSHITKKCDAMEGLHHLSATTKIKIIRAASNKKKKIFHQSTSPKFKWGSDQSERGQETTGDESGSASRTFDDPTTWRATLKEQNSQPPPYKMFVKICVSRDNLAKTTSAKWRRGWISRNRLSSDLRHRVSLTVEGIVLEAVYLEECQRKTEVKRTVQAAEQRTLRSRIWATSEWHARHD